MPRIYYSGESRATGPLKELVSSGTASVPAGHAAAIQEGQEPVG